MPSEESRELNAAILAEWVHGNAAYETSARETVGRPSHIKDRSPGNTPIAISEKDDGYDHCLKKLEANVSDALSKAMLISLYVHKHYLSHNPVEFHEFYRNTFTDERRWRAILAKFPFIDQSTFAKMTGINDTTVSTRLEDLETVGIVKRSSDLPPSPKFVEITEAGSCLMDSWVADMTRRLLPLLLQHAELAQSELAPNEDNTSEITSNPKPKEV